MRWALPIVTGDQTLHHVELVTIGLNYSIWACNGCGLIFRIGTDAHDFRWDGEAFVLGQGPPIWPGHGWRRDIQECRP